MYFTKIQSFIYKVLTDFLLYKISYFLSICKVFVKKYLRISIIVWIL